MNRNRNCRHKTTKFLSDMTYEQQTVLLAKGLIAELPADQRETCEELINHIKANLKCAGEPIATISITLITAEMQLAATQ